VIIVYWSGFIVQTGYRSPVAMLGDDDMNVNDSQWTAQLENWVNMYRAYVLRGETASYIPALKEVDSKALGICIHGVGHEKMTAGNFETPFTMQSVSKVVNLLAACETRGIHSVLDEVDVEPTGDAFDSIIRLEAHKPGKPFNPMINAGAITIASMLPGLYATNKFAVFMDLLEQMLGRRPSVNEEVFASEWQTAHRNRALAHYLKSLGYLDSSVEQALEVYIRECSVEVTTEDLAKIGLILAHDGFDPETETQVVSSQAARITKSLMVTCGMYNASGKFAAFVGIPAKSGVSGGILAAVPRRNLEARTPFSRGCGIGIYGPAIDEFGNSVAGVALLKQISSDWNFNIF
jgi:glutaminase